MLIGFVGDVHGRVFHALAALATWQTEAGRRLDLLVQVGDMGAFPELERMDAATQRYLTVDPAEADFGRLLRADGERAEILRGLRAQLASSVHFLRGNHEDFDWLRSLPIDSASGTARVDPFDTLRYVPDGTVLEFGDVKLAFLGGVEELPGEPAIDPSAYESLMNLTPGAVDVLVTHQGPYGTSVGYRGDTQGSRLMTALIEHLQPPYHVAGHAHELVGPRLFGRTTYLGLAALVASARWHPEARGLQEGCLGVLDTSTGSLSPVREQWLSNFDAPPFDFDSWYRRRLDPYVKASQ